MGDFNSQSGSPISAAQRAKLSLPFKRALKTVLKSSVRLFVAFRLNYVFNCVTNSFPLIFQNNNDAIAISIEGWYFPTFSLKRESTGPIDHDVHYQLVT